MATHVRENVSIDVVADVVDATCAALESDPETGALVATWTALTSRADALLDSRRKLDRALLRARSRLAVRDGIWDGTVAAFGRAVFDASGGRRDQSPYTRFFPKATPSGVQAFGIQREIETAEGWLVELARNPNEALAKIWTPKLKEATDALAMAGNARNDALKALAPQQTSVVLFIDDVNRELDRLEGDLKKLFPGAPERVASYLAATRPSRSTAADDPTPTPPAPTGESK